ATDDRRGGILHRRAHPDRGTAIRAEGGGPGAAGGAHGPLRGAGRPHFGRGGGGEAGGSVPGDRALHPLVLQAGAKDAKTPAGWASKMSPARRGSRRELGGE